MDNSHSGLVIQQTNICSNFHCQLNNIWLRYNKKAKGMFFLWNTVYTDPPRSTAF